MTPGVIYDGTIGSYSGVTVSSPTPAPSWSPESYFTLSKEDTGVLLRMIEAFKVMEKQKAAQPPAKRPRGRPRKVPPVPTKATKTKLTVGRAPRLSAGTTALSKLWSKALAEKIDEDVLRLMTDEDT